MKNAIRHRTEHRDHGLLVARIAFHVKRACKEEADVGSLSSFLPLFLESGICKVGPNLRDHDSMVRLSGAAQWCVYFLSRVWLVTFPILRLSFVTGILSALVR